MAVKPIRPIRVCGDVAIVTLTRGKEALVDALDVHLIDGRHWYASKSSHGWYALARSKRPDGGVTTEKMHRLILNAPHDKMVDHRDCDGLNNRRSNLRIADAFENARNTRIRKNNKSGTKGVYFDSARNKWAALIAASGKKYALGRFETAAEARAAYRAAARILHGDFARLS